MQLTQAQKYALLFIAGILIVLTSWYAYRLIPHNPEPVTLISPSASPGPTGHNEIFHPKTSSSKILTIQICGAVKNPGIYKLPEGSRIYEALKLAGNATIKANLEGVNLARKIHDEEQIVVPALTGSFAAEGKPANALTKEPAEIKSAPRLKVLEEFPTEEQTSKSNIEHKIDINQATLEELETLPGIGAKIAQRIIDYRSANGNFTSEQDLLQIPGIGEAKLEKLKPYIEL
jgi:competence protein ComEA